MIVAAPGQVAFSGSRLEDSLSQSDACGNLVFLHLFNGNLLISVDVLLVAAVPFGLGRHSDGNQQRSHESERAEAATYIIGVNRIEHTKKSQFVCKNSENRADFSTNF